MTKDDVIRMARKAGWIIHDDLPYLDVIQVQDALLDRIERIVKAAYAAGAAAERGACAKVCEAEGLLWGQRYAAAIRARGETK